jgi:hypothetical protein
MGAYSQDQIRDIIIASAEATESTASTFVSTASNLEARVLKIDGSNVPSTTEDFYVISKRSDGTIKRSDVIPYGNVNYVKKTAPVAEVYKATQITIPSGLAAGTVARLDFVFYNWGSASFEDQYFKLAAYKVLTGDTTNDIANGLLASLGRNFMREEPTVSTTTSISTYAYVNQYTGVDDATAQANAFADEGNLTLNDYVRVTGTTDNIYQLTSTGGLAFADDFTKVADYSAFTVQDNPYFTFSKSMATGGAISITITEKAQEFVLGKKQGRRLIWEVSNDFDATQVVTEPVVNPASGRHVADMEWFFRGNTGDFYRGMGYPHNFENVYDASTSTDYYIIEVGFFYQGQNEAIQKSNKQLTIAVSDMTAANALLADIVTATGITVAAFA